MIGLPAWAGYQQGSRHDHPPIEVDRASGLKAEIIRPGNGSGGPVESSGRFADRLEPLDRAGRTPPP